MELERRITVIRQLEIELLVAAIDISKRDRGLAAQVLDTSFATIDVYSRLDPVRASKRMEELMLFNRKSIFTISKSFAKPNRNIPLKTPPLSEAAIRIKSLVRKISVSIRDIACSVNEGADTIMVLFGLTEEQSVIIRNSSVDELEEWVYQNPCVLDLKFKKPDELLKLVNIKLTREAGMYLDKLAS